MNLTREDIRAAVSTGTITDAQAARILILAEIRAGHRSSVAGQDEPFELFHGFNEVFIILGFLVVFSGWFWVTLVLFQSGIHPVSNIAMGIVGMGALSLLARYFTLRRKMNGPSSMLAALFAFCSGQTGLGVGLTMSSDIFTISGLGAAAAALGMLAYWFAFRVPFALFLIMACLFASSFCFIAVSGSIPQSPLEFFQLSASGLYGWATVLLGLIALVVAMGFDMSDPHRVTRRALNGFWLHVIAAPAIVNTIALTLFLNGTTLSYVVLTVFLVLLAAFSLTIDRRSFLIAGAVYVAGISFQIIAEAFVFTAFILGSSLVILGAQWEVLRNRLMTALPPFPGKDRLPPWSADGPLELRTTARQPDQ